MCFLRQNKYIISVVLITLLAIIYRFAAYICNAPFGGDEANLVIPLIQHSYKNILFVYDELGELAPPLFFFAEKIITNIFGISEYSVRIIPFVSSVISCVLYYFFCERLLNRGGSKLFALLMFSLSSPLIFFAGFYKPYSSEVAVSMIALYILCFKVDFKDKSPRFYFAVSLFCLLCFLASYQSVFIIYSCLTILLLHNFLFEKNMQTLKNILRLTAFNSIYLLLYYHFFLYKMRTQIHLNYLWTTDYSFFPDTWKDLG